MQSISGVIGLIGVGGLSAYVMHHRQSDNMRQCIQNMNALERLLKNVPQNEDGENKSQAIGRAVSLLVIWRSESWLHQALTPPPWNSLLEEDSWNSSSSEDESSSSEGENENHAADGIQEGDDGIQEHQEGDGGKNDDSSETF